MLLAGSSCCIPLAWGPSSPSAILACHHFSLLWVKTVPSGCSGYTVENLPASAWSHTCWLGAHILDLGTLAAGKLFSPSAACWVCQWVLGNVPWWVENACSASEVVAVAVGGSSDLAHAASPAWGILCAACSSAVATHPHWPHNYRASCQTGVSQLIQVNFNWTTFAHCEQVPVSQALVMLTGTRECSAFTCMLSVGLQAGMLPDKWLHICLCNP